MSPVKELEVSLALDELEHSMKRLLDSIHGLEDRLTPVLLSERTAANIEEHRVKDCPLAKRIDNISDVVFDAQRHVDLIANTLQI